MSSSLKLVGLLGLFALAGAGNAQVARSAVSDRDSIEVVALRFMKATLPAARSFVFEPRVRGPGRLAASRSEQQIARLLGELNAQRGVLGCGRDTSACAKLHGSVGIVLLAPDVSGDQATITVEQHFEAAIGSDTYLVGFEKGTWTVSKILSRSAT